MYFEKISLFALSLLFSQPTFAQESIPLTFTPSAIITKIQLTMILLNLLLKSEL